VWGADDFAQTWADPDRPYSTRCAGGSDRKAAGRGAYLHNCKECWETGLKGSLAHALKVALTDQDRERLLTTWQLFQKIALKIQRYPLRRDLESELICRDNERGAVI